MKRVAILLPDGYEEMEALAVVDVLRRGKIDIDMISANPTLKTTGDHGIVIYADKLLSEVNASDYDMAVTPGGLPGTKQLQADAKVLAFLSDCNAAGKYVASICASPIVLGVAKIAGQYTGTCYPGCETKVGFKKYVEDMVVIDRNLITACGPAAAVPFALALLEILAGSDVAEKVAAAMLWPRLEAAIVAGDELLKQVHGDK